MQPINISTITWINGRTRLNQKNMNDIEGRLTIIANKINELVTYVNGVTVDRELSDVSTNPVQNKVVTGALAAKQDTLVSGTNIKTLNGAGLVGAGDLSLGDLVGLRYLTSNPGSPNTGNLKIVVLNSEPKSKQDGYLYLIKE